MPGLGLIVFEKGHLSPGVLCVHPSPPSGTKGGRNNKGEASASLSPPRDCGLSSLSPSTALSLTTWDDEMASPQGYEAETNISRVWRGFRCRREVKSHRILEEFQAKRALMIQCWWRRSLAMSTLRRLRREREKNRILACQRHNTLLVNRIDESLLWFVNAMHRAATTIQKCVRLGKSVNTMIIPHPPKRTMQSAKNCLDRAARECEYLYDIPLESPPRATLTRDEAACVVQRFWRVVIAKRIVKASLIRRRYETQNAIKIQRKWRSYYAISLKERLWHQRETQRQKSVAVYHAGLVASLVTEAVWHEVSLTEASNRIGIAWKVKSQARAQGVVPKHISKKRQKKQ